METRKGLAAPRRPRTWQSSLRAGCAALLVSAVVLLAGGCASPAEPIERKPPVPQPVGDLAAAQSGNSVILTFALPREAVDHRSLDHPLSIEIYRDFEPPLGTPPGSSAKPLAAAPRSVHATIPAAVVDTYTDQGRIRYADTLQPQDFMQSRDSVAVYIVRTRASAKQESADSNVVALRLHPAPEPISDVKAGVTHSGIQVTWTPPQQTPVGPAPPIALYRVYRAMSQPATSANLPATEKETAKPASPVLKVGETEATSYLDTQFDLGKSYVYTVRSVLRYDEEQIESADSNPFVVLARDVSPPASPRGLIVVYVPAQDTVPAHLELSWGISPETDLAGYNVYRSEQAGLPGTRMNSELLLTPAFRDMNAAPGRLYFYSVGAVDRSGNESPASAAVAGTVPAESQTTQ
jgi:hypothetical protein